MPLLSCLPDGKTIDASPDRDLFNVAREAGVPHVGACGGQGRCSTCRVAVLEGLEHCLPRTEAEGAIAERLGFGPSIRLACQTRLSGRGGVKVRRLVLDDEDAALARENMKRGCGASAGAQKRVGILFADIRGFTSFAEGLPPYDVIHALNRYFHRMGEAIAGRGGYIDNYIGDGLLAVFGAKASANGERETALAAIGAGLDMLGAMEGFNAYLEPLHGRRLEIGVGVHFGEAVLGTVGAAGNKRETVIGDAVNLASRVEAATKDAGVRLLASADAHALAQGAVTVGKRLKVPVRGKSGEHELFEITGVRERGLPGQEGGVPDAQP